MPSCRRWYINVYGQEPQAGEKQSELVWVKWTLEPPEELGELPPGVGESLRGGQHPAGSAPASLAPRGAVLVPKPK